MDSGKNPYVDSYCVVFVGKGTRKETGRTKGFTFETALKKAAQFRKAGEECYIEETWSVKHLPIRS